MNSLLTPSIKRSFRDLSDAEVADIEQASALARMGWTGSFGWDELLRSQRVLTVSEAGAGKTYECQTQQSELWNAGEPGQETIEAQDPGSSELGHPSTYRLNCQLSR